MKILSFLRRGCWCFSAGRPLLHFYPRKFFRAWFPAGRPKDFFFEGHALYSALFFVAGALLSPGRKTFLGITLARVFFPR